MIFFRKTNVIYGTGCFVFKFCMIKIWFWNFLIIRFGGRKFSKITRKGPLKISCGREILMAVRPQIWAKSGRKGAGKHFLTVLSFFRGSFEIKFVWVTKLSWYIKYFLFKPHKNYYYDFAEFFFQFCWFFCSNWLVILGETW